MFRIYKIILIVLLAILIFYAIGKKCNIEFFQILDENSRFLEIAGNQYSCKDFYDKKIREGLVKEDICTIQLNNGIYKTFCPSYCEITEINDSKNTIEKCVNICSINDLSAEQTDIKFSINQLNEFLNNLNSDEENINLTINDFS